MNDEIIIGFILICATIVGGLILVLFVLLNSSIRLKPYKTKKPEKDWKIRATQDTVSWAEKNSFDFLGYYTVHFGMRAFMAAWQLKEQSSYLCQYVMKINISIIIYKEIFLRSLRME